MNSKDIAIKVENLSKRYRIGLKKEMHDSVGGAIFDFIKSPLKNYRKYRSLYKFDDIKPGRLESSRENHSDIIWALNDVSFEVKQGELMGIIGRNGSGKSTLLKILAKIIDPTVGYAEIRGKVSSLLEVGTGFHRELTGRENVYLNGTILGMRKKEVDRKFDEIVDFSGVERFIDTPVKRYSSGMMVRLAFSVAAHLEPEILIIDEVLAVGDAEFQKKCINKMKDVGQQGRTVLFVSHNMPAVLALCHNAIMLQDGILKYTGRCNDAVTFYLNNVVERPNQPLRERQDREGSGVVRVADIWLENENGKRLSEVMIGQKLTIKVLYNSVKIYPALRFVITVDNDLDGRVFRFDSEINPPNVAMWPIEGILSCNVSEPFPLCPGNYKMSVAVFALADVADFVLYAVQFSVSEGDFFGTGKLPSDAWPMFLLNHEWNLEEKHPNCRS